jgi:hypothetical protein
MQLCVKRGMKLGLSVLAALGLLGAASANNKMVVVKDGQARAVIVVPDNADSAETFAAAELQKYIEKISGARLEITPEGKLKVDPALGPSSARIFVGHVKAASQLINQVKRRNTDAFTVRVERQQIGRFINPGHWDDRPGTWHDLFLVGACGRGTVYAVYDFLERDLGCRWLAASERWEEIPHTATIEVPEGKRVEAPAFKYRQDWTMIEPGWGLKHKANVGAIRRFSRLFHWWPNNETTADDSPPEELMLGWENPHAVPEVVWYVSRNNPEWFALGSTDMRWVGGDGDRHKGQLCFSNPELHDLIAELLSQAFRECPGLDFVELGCADGLSANHCQCPQCVEMDSMDTDLEGNKRGKHTCRWLTLVNTVAERLAESDPGKKLLALAYDSFQEPPNPVIIKPADNVMILYATWANCRVHGYEHTVEDDTRLPECESHEKSREWIKAWSEITPGGLYMWEYLHRASMDYILTPTPRRWITDMRWLKKHDFAIGYYGFGDTTPWGMYIINRYTALKAMWNPEIDPDELTKDFCDHAFHAASGDMQKFIKTLEDSMQDAGCSHVRVTSWITPEVVAEAQKHLDAAKAAATGDEVALLRLREFEWHLRFNALAGPAYERWVKVVAQGERNPEVMREAIKLGEEALAYKKEMLQKHPGELFKAGYNLASDLRQNGAWHRLLEQVEKEAAAAQKD